MKTLRSLLLTLVFVAAFAVPAFSLDRVQFLYSMNPPSSWVNMSARDTRIGFGDWIYNALGSSNGYFGNLCTSTATGLNVTVGPCSANSFASLYQYLPEESSPFGGGSYGPSTALPADNNQVDVQGIMSPAQALTIGPLNPPGTAGQSIVYIVECKVNTLDTTSQTVSFVSSTGSVVSSSANRDRADQIFCQSKAGTAGVSPSAPAVDTGYIGTSQITVPYGTSTLTSGMIAATTANGMYGFARVASAGLSASLPVCTDANAKVTTSGCNAGTVTSVSASSPLSSTGGTTPNITFSATAAGLPPVFNASGTLQTASTLHTVVITGLTQNWPSSCANGTICTTGGLFLTGSSVFSSTTSYTCAWNASSAPAGVILSGYEASANNPGFSIYNGSGGALAAQTITVNGFCTGT